MHILITNDDGIHALGLKDLVQSIQSITDQITIVAPADQRSGASISTNFIDPLKITRVDWPGTTAYTVASTPADCIKAALGILLPSPPDFIVSGINHGTNAGRNALYSGTVGGVIEGILRGIPGIAFSYYNDSAKQFPDIKAYIPPIVQYFIDNPLPTGTLINVNFPEGAVKGIELTRQGKAYHLEDPIHHGHSHYRIAGKWTSFEEHKESDVFHLSQGYITCSPLHVNELTDHTVLNHHKENFQATLAKYLQ
ncbi:MAG: 5'/3'-nucleotidase SurE [Simkaniaceae bacterium]|nr:5'/3'-nucleotidase SurE [Simkaniaceae bacterium]